MSSTRRWIDIYLTIRVSRVILFTPIQDSFLASIGVPVFACTPDLFPDLMASAIQKQDIGQWAATHNIPIARGSRELE